MKELKRVFIVLLVVWGFIYIARSIVHASPGIRMQVPPFPAKIFKLNRHGDPSYIFTWDDCLRTRGEIIINLIAKDPIMEYAIDNGDFIVECVELDADGNILEEEEEE